MPPTRLEMVGVNFGRSAGPALAGLVIAVLGVPAVFALNAISGFFFTVVLLRWRRERAGLAGRRERFVPALRAGGRYVWHEPVVRRILLRTVLFIAPGTVLWALLPLVARQQLGLGASGYGVLFGALGVGAIVAAVVVGPGARHLSTQRLLAVAGVVYALALVVLVLVPSFVAALISLVFAGLAWTAVVSIMNAELQLFLPVWVRARGLAVYLMTFTGCLAFGSLIWGLVTNQLGVQTTILDRSGSGGCWSGRRRLLVLARHGRHRRRAGRLLARATACGRARGRRGPVVVTVEYTVAPDREPASSRRCSSCGPPGGGLGQAGGSFIATPSTRTGSSRSFRVPSWEEHLRQHAGRLTAHDQESRRPR